MDKFEGHSAHVADVRISEFGAHFGGRNDTSVLDFFACTLTAMRYANYDDVCLLLSLSFSQNIVVYVSECV